MKRTFLLLFSLFSLVSLQAENKVSLTLIPPGKSLIRSIWISAVAL